jgi:hypothetical protein
MLTKFDEMTCHQIVSTFDAPLQTDRAWTEKIWCHVHDTTGKLALATGLGVYPNRNVLDAYGCLNVEGKTQTNLRLSRELRPRIDEMVVGPFSYQVREPFRRVRMAMDDNPQGLSYDLEFLGKLEPGEEEPHQFWRDKGRVSVDTCRYAQLGRASGWIRYGGQKYTVDENRFWAQRDHSWGVRMGVGAPEQGVQTSDVSSFVGMMINWATLQFEDWGIYCYYIETADGKPRLLAGKVVGPLADASGGAGQGEPKSTRITTVEHEYAFHAGSARMKSGRVVFGLQDGRKLAVEMEALTTLYLRGGGYLGCDDFYHGLWMGPSWSAGETWDLSDPAVVERAHGLDDTVCKLSCNGETGYGIVENLILPPFPRYGFKGRWVP